MAGILEVTLERDGHDQPWGFRLQGGHDVGMPLSIQRVLVGTPADGILKKGDVLLRISQTDARGLSHQQAADLFTNTGNQIFIQFKRAGASSQGASIHPSVTPSQPVPVSGGVALHGMTTKSPGRSPDTLLLNLSKSRGGTNPYSSTVQHSTSTPLSLTIQNQPYRTSPLIQPSAKIDVGPGSAVHLKIQAEYLSGAREPLYTMEPRASEFTMKQKVTGTLQQIQQSGSKSPVPMASSQATPSKQYYNNPINLYSNENVAEVARMNKMGMSALPASPTGLIHPTNKPHKPLLNMGGLPKKYDPEASATWQAIHESENNKIQQVVLTPSKDYNPKDSATWRALQESDPSLVDPEKLANYTSLREHDPIYSEVYTPQHLKSASPQPASGKASQGDSTHLYRNEDPNTHSRSPGRLHSRSPVAELLPPSFGGKTEHTKAETTSEPHQSAVVAAALADSKLVDLHSKLLDPASVPLFETNSIGGRKRIAQSATFNKLMMDVLGE